MVFDFFFFFLSVSKHFFPALFSSQVLVYTLSCVCTSAFSAGIIEAAEAEDIMSKLQLLVENNQQVVMYSSMVSLLSFLVPLHAAV